MKHVPRFIIFFPESVLHPMLCVVGCLVWFYVMYFLGINVMLPVTTLLLNKIHYMKDKVISMVAAGHPACFPPPRSASPLLSIGTCVTFRFPS